MFPQIGCIPVCGGIWCPQSVLDDLRIGFKDQPSLLEALWKFSYIMCLSLSTFRPKQKLALPFSFSLPVCLCSVDFLPQQVISLSGPKEQHLNKTCKTDSICQVCFKCNTIEVSMQSQGEVWTSDSGDWLCCPGQEFAPPVRCQNWKDLWLCWVTFVCSQSVRLHAHVSRITAIVRLCYSVRQLQIIRVYMPVRKSNYWPEHVKPRCDKWRCTHFN